MDANQSGGVVMRRRKTHQHGSILVQLWLGVALLGASAPAHAQDAPPSGLSVENPLSAINPASLTGFRERPLFSPSRQRPPAPDVQPESEVEQPAEQAPAAPNLQLLGVIGTPDGVSALILDQDDDTRHALRKDDTYRGWTVTELDKSEIVLTSKAEEILRLSLFAPSTPTPAE